MKKILPIVLLGFIFVSCYNPHFKEKDICGNYTLEAVYFDDTISLYPDHKYHRRSYHNETNKLIFESDGVWDISNNNQLSFVPKTWKLNYKMYAHRYVMQTMPHDSIDINISNGTFRFKIEKLTYMKIRNR